LCAREFASISDHFAQVNRWLDDIEAKIEVFGRRIDDEATAPRTLRARLQT
jgi:hypothetical protein